MVGKEYPIMTSIGQAVHHSIELDQRTSGQGHGCLYVCHCGEQLAAWTCPGCGGLYPAGKGALRVCF